MKTSNKTISPWFWVPTLYFAEGVPYFVVNNISVMMFTKMGVPNGDMAFFTTLLYFPWFLKGLWGPLVDVVKTKRWWILSMQVLMTALMILLTVTLPKPDVATIASGQTPISMFTITLILFIIAAFASATHDIAADGYDAIIPTMLSGLPDILIAVVVVLVLSASMSTLSSLVLASSSTLTLDFLKDNILKDMSEKRQVFIMRCLIVVFIAISVVIALVLANLCRGFFPPLDKLAAGENTANVGKLIYGNTWYYAATVTQEEAQRIAGCGSVSLRLTKGITDDIAAQVYSVSPAEDGRCVVVLACREYLAETTQLRHQTAQIVLHSYTGLRLPSVCLRQQEDGTLGVYCAQGSFSRFKPVDMVYQGDDYVLVSVPQNTDGLDTLRPGDEVIMTGVTLDGSQILTGD